MEAFSKRMGKFNLVLKIISILLLIWAIFTKMDGMNDVANILLIFSGSINAFILMADYVYRRLVKWVSNIEGLPIDEFIVKTARKYEESLRAQ